MFSRKAPLRTATAPGDGRSSPWLTLPRLLAMLLAGAVLLGLGLTDPVATGLALLGGMAIAFLLHRRSATTARTAAVSLVLGATVLAVLAALSLPTYQSRPHPLVVNQGADHPVAPAPLPAGSAAAGGGFIALGFVASDYDDSAAGVDRDAPRLSTLAATGIVLARSPGSIEVSAASDSLVRAHLNGATGLAVISNYDGTDFNGDRAAAMLHSPEAQRRFISAVVSEVARRGWDGAVLDFENLPRSVRQEYPKLAHHLAETMGARRVVVAVPAFTNPAELDVGAYDLAALASAADQIVLMAYDQHELTDPPGPVAGLPWVRQVVALARSAVPKDKLLLGIPGYGYAWSERGRVDEVTAPEAKNLLASPGASAAWDDAQGEWHGRTADGRELWYDDARSFALRARFAVDEGLAGVALWRVGSEDPGALAQLPTLALKHDTPAPEREVEQVRATGLVALTFDDGPDPSWTGPILDVLRHEHVPATFFVIGTEAQKHPELLRQEMRNGYVVANHTYSHRNLGKANSLRARFEILGDQVVVEGITGRKPYLFRSPYGAGDMTGRKLGSDQLATDLGLHVVNWNDDPDDWQRVGTATITRRVLAGATERTVVLLHDGGGDRRETVAALPGIIDGLRARGFLFTTVDGLDASIPSPYIERRGLLDQARGLAIIAAFRLEMALRRVVMALLVAIIAISLVRLLVSPPLALAQARAARRWRRRPGPVPAGLSVTVIIPAHNEARVIGKSLRAIANLAGPRPEVIVVDDGSTDGTATVAGRYPCRVIREPQLGKASALNAGIAAAEGDVVVVLDADTVLTPGFLAAVLPHFADPQVAAVAGNVKVGNRHSFLARLQALEYIVSLNLDRRAQAQLNIISVVPGAAGAFRRRALLAVGGYPTDTLVEDADLTTTLLLAGWRIPYEASAVAWTEAPERFSDVLRQRRRWSYGTVEVAAKHAGRMLDPGAGRVGLLGLPWMVASQVVLPVAGPLADVFLLYLLLVGDMGMAVVILGLALLIDLAVVAVAVLAEGEDRRLLLWVPFLRLVWRPLQLFAVFRSVGRWSLGGAERWRKIERYGTVELPVPGAALRPSFRLSGAHENR